MSLGVTTSSQAVYGWPDDFLLPLQVSLEGGDPLDPADPTTVRQYERDTLSLLQDRVYYEAPGDDGVRRLALYPEPSDGLVIELEYVYAPAPMTADADEPTEIPRPFHEALLPASAATYYETVEDNPELAQRSAEQLDLWVGKLARYDIQRRGGSNPFQVPIVGVSA